MDEAKEEEVTPVKNKGGRPRKKVRKQRLKQPPKLSRRKHRIRSRAAKEAVKDPEVYAKCVANLAKARAARKGPPRLGVPDGWTRERADVQRVYDGIRADYLIDKMKAEGMVDETKPGDFEVLYVEVAGKQVEVRVPKTEAGMAEAALREAVIGALSPLTHGNNKPTYIRTVLEWTKPKPAQTSNVNLNSEDWLAAALEDNSTYDAEADTDEGASSAP
jgi:hypothetical protein